MDFPDRKYNIVYVDPPWQYRENWGNGAVKHHYLTLSFEELKKLPVAAIADENCHLYLWVTCPFIQEGLELVKTWGFEYKQIITWVKTDGSQPVMGLGYYFRVATEHCLFAVKGNLPRINKHLKNVVLSRQREHSEKPGRFRHLIVQHSGDLPRIELFAREKIEGWDAWGLEVPATEQKLLSCKQQNIKINPFLKTGEG